MNCFERFEPTRWHEGGIVTVARAETFARAPKRTTPWTSVLVLATGLVLGSTDMARLQVGDEGRAFSVVPGYVVEADAGSTADVAIQRPEPGIDEISPETWPKLIAYLKGRPAVPPDDFGDEADTDLIV